MRPDEQRRRPSSPGARDGESPAQVAGEADRKGEGDSDRAVARRLLFRSQRDRLAAPELERYLGQRDVDLQVVDQIEALRVRVERGIAVLSERARAASAQTRRLRFTLRAAAVLALAGIIGWALLGGAWERALGASVGIALFVTWIRYELLLGEDLRRLASIADEDSHRMRAASCTELLELFSYSQSLGDRVRELAGARETP